jgi:hypothetical protein
MACAFQTSPVLAEEGGHHELHKNHLAVFVGWTHAEGEDEPTIGLDYERRLNERFGVGAVIDYAGGDLESTIIAPALFLHAGPWVLLGAVGNEHAEGEDEIVYRLGLSYQIEAGDWTIAPGVNFDKVEDHETKEVFGVGIGRGF